jgi:hypothetical protein
MEGSGPIPRECLQRNLERVRARMAEAAARVSRAPDAVRLVAVTKTVGVAEVRALSQMGVSDFGESRVQDAERKIRELNALADKPPVAQRTWHLIGHLQTNKADKAARLFQAMHSVDALRVAQALDKERAKANLPPLPCLLEVNVAGEESKFGLRPDATEICELLKACAELPRLRVTGLMTMAPYAEEPEPTSRPVFRRLRELREEINTRGVTPQPLSELSMGMSQDYAIAIEEGATLVRVGSTLFEH